MRGGSERNPLRAEEAGFYEHRADAERRNLWSQRLDPSLDTELRRGVGRDKGLPGNAAGRGDRHDESAALSTHDGEHGARDVHRAEQVGFELCAEVFGGDFFEEPRVEVTGVVDEHVDSTEVIHDSGRPHDVDAHATAGTGHEPDAFVSHGESSCWTHRLHLEAGPFNTSRSAVQVSRDLLGDLLAYPYRYKLRDLARVESGRVYPVGHPQFLLLHRS
jgi:hypothetical protein